MLTPAKPEFFEVSMSEHYEDDYAIDAASIAGVNLEQISKTYPEKSKEIARIGELLNMGEETEDDLLQLGRLLYEVGEVKESEYLLRRNTCEENDAVHQLYSQLHGTAAEDYFMQSVVRFASQFGVELSQKRRNDFLWHTYQATPIGILPGVDAEMFEMLSGPCEVNFSYVDMDEITAILTSTSPDRPQPEEYPGADYSFPLVFQDGQWISDEKWQN